MKPKVIVIVGPTGVGKTKLSVELAKKLNGEIISGDSVQVYKRMDIGSAKVTEEEKAPILEKKEALKKSLENNASVEELKNGMEELSKAFYAISEKLYKAAQEAQE